MPDSHTRFGGVLVEKWQEEDRERNANYVRSARVSFSSAGQCARRMGLELLGVPRVPIEKPGIHVMRIGTIIHEHWQAAMKEAVERGDFGEDTTIELEPRVTVDGLDGSGRVDAVLREQRVTSDGKKYEWVTVVELKTKGGFGYKLAVGQRGAAQGPGFENLQQAGLYGLALDADEVVIVYIATEAISVAAAKGRKHIDELTRMAVDFTFTPDEFEPVAKMEVKRMNRIMELVDCGELAPKSFPNTELPPRHEIVDPKSGSWRVIDPETGATTNTGKWWACNYCPYQEICQDQPMGIIDIPVDLIPKPEEAAELPEGGE